MDNPVKEAGGNLKGRVRVTMNDFGSHRGRAVQDESLICIEDGNVKWFSSCKAQNSVLQFSTCLFLFSIRERASLSCSQHIGQPSLVITQQAFPISVGNAILFFNI